jgi:hypothetical protein
MNFVQTKKISRKKTIIAIVVFLLVFVISAKPVAAAPTLGEDIASVVSWILSGINYALGYILTFLFTVLVSVAQYNDFIKSAPVTAGWVIVRDLCNMFFILILLVIAFATILRVESYPWKKLLPKLILMAVLINFSKTICGLIIDFSQVIMLTFVSAFSQNGANNLVGMFQVDQYLSTGKCSVGSGLSYAILLGSISGTIALVITLVVTVVLVAILVMRIVMLWIYVILSPLAYLLSAFPQGSQYSGRWWSEFSKNVTTGPILAFFLWLALTTASTTTIETGTVNNALYNSAAATSKSATSTVCGGTDLFTTGPFQKYIVIIGLLVGGLIVTQQAGGMAGGMASKGLGWAKKFSGAAVAGTAAAAIWKKSSQATKDAVVATAKTTARTGLRAGGAIIGAGAASDSTRGKIGTFVNTWGNEMKTNRMKEKTKKRQKTLEKFGMGEKTMEALEVVAKDEKVKRATGIVKGAVLGAGVGIATGGLGFVPAMLGASGGGVAGVSGQAIKEGFGGLLEKWGLKKAEGRNKDIQELNNRKDTAISRLESNREDSQAKIDLARGEALADQRMRTAPGARLRAAESDLAKFDADPESDAEISRLKRRGAPKEEINQAIANKKNSLQKTLNQAENDFNESTAVRDIRTKHKTDSDKNTEAYTKEKQLVEEKFQGFFKAQGLDKQIGAGVSAGIRDFGKYLKNYNPNHLTAEAAKEGAKEMRGAADLRNKLTRGDLNIEDTEDKKLYSASGITSSQQKFFDKLSDGTRESAEAINNMAKSLAKFSSGLQKPTKDQPGNLVALKQLIASQISAGKSTDHLSSVIGHLDKIDTGDKKDRVKVEDFVEKKT